MSDASTVWLSSAAKKSQSATTPRFVKILSSRWVKVVVDILLINIAAAASWYVRYELQWFRDIDPENYSEFTAYIPFSIGFTVLIMIAFWINGIYKFRRGTAWTDEMLKVGNGVVFSVMIAIVITFGVQPLSFSRLLFLYAATFTIALLGLVRIFWRILANQLRRRGYNLKNVLIVGAGEKGRAIMRALVARHDLGYNIVGFLDDNPSVGEADVGRFKALGPLSRLPDLLKSGAIDEVIVSLPWQAHTKIVEVVELAEAGGVFPRVVPDLLQFNFGQIEVDQMGGVPLISTRPDTFTKTNLIIKRVIDLTLITIFSPFVLAVCGLIAIAIKLTSKGPVLFEQTRVGLRGKEFTLYKFRTMVPNAEALQADLMDQNEASGPLFKMKDDPRITMVGSWLRRTSLDELPQLINVFIGNMSLVGPRPGLPSEVAEYEPWQHNRLNAKPGITGMWQVSGRSDVTFDEMCLLDIYYVENWSIVLDLSCLIRTIPTVLFARGAY